jgi:L-ascorbate metabolism protein UlaG (beta-lactamase superfamily)
MSAIDQGDVDDVSLILISHAHGDHLCRRTLGRMPRRATIVVPFGCAALVSDFGFADVVELSAGQVHRQSGVRVTAVPARHSGKRGFVDRKRRGSNGYVIEWEGRSVYFAGDTGYFSGFSEIGRRYAPEIALVPIGGYQPAPFRAEHMSPLDAVYAFEDLRSRVLIPIAYGSFLLSYERFEEPLAWLREATQQRGHSPALTVLDHGQTCLLQPASTREEPPGRVHFQG